VDKRSFQQHLDPSFGPKRILALDGGGLRGVVTLAFLKKIESILADQSGRGNAFRLSDYYDLIGGTSTGAIIAAGLSLGMSVEEIRAHYYRLGESVFKSSIFHFGILNQKYDATKVASALQEVFSSRTLGSEDYKTGLAVMSKRLDTGSQWVLGNNPRARYFNGGTSSDTTPNSSYPLWAVVRASTAAPTYFDPEFIQITPPDAQQGLPAVVGEFVDGGVSTLNNPALQLVLMATAQGYGFNWKMGEHDLSVTSVGTGRASKELGLTSIIGAAAAPHAIKSLKSVLEDCADLVEMMMQWLSQRLVRLRDAIQASDQACATIAITFISNLLGSKSTSIWMFPRKS
jgi:predicted acylesterase/phospholipase RssA